MVSTSPSAIPPGGGCFRMPFLTTPAAAAAAAPAAAGARGIPSSNPRATSASSGATPNGSLSDPLAVMAPSSSSSMGSGEGSSTFLIRPPSPPPGWCSPPPPLLRCRRCAGQTQKRTTRLATTRSERQPRVPTSAPVSTSQSSGSVPSADSPSPLLLYRGRGYP